MYLNLDNFVYINATSSLASFTGGSVGRLEVFVHVADDGVTKTVMYTTTHNCNDLYVGPSAVAAADKYNEVLGAHNI